MDNVVSSISFEHSFPVNIGDVFYRLETECQTFFGNCPACAGLGKISVNSVTFDCPVCKTGERSICRIRHYYVRAYRISAICVEEQDTTFWKTSERTLVTFLLRRHNFKGEYKDNSRIRVCSESLKKCALKEQIQPDFFYKDYESAVEIASSLNEKELQSLEAFNSKQNTHHILSSWKMENDTKRI